MVVFSEKENREGTLKNLAAILCFITFLSSCIIEEGSTLFDRPAVNACTFSVDPLTGFPIKWEKTRFPISFYPHESVPLEAYQNFVAAMKYWNFVWLDYLTERGVEAPPLFDIIGENELFSAVPKRDGYNVLFFTNNFNKYYGDQSSAKTQAVTIVRRNKNEIKDADIVVNVGNFRFFYDNNYNRDIEISSQKKYSARNLSSSRSLTLMESIKVKLLSFFKGFLRLLKREVSPLRGIAAREALIPQGFVDFPSLMIHELGHVPGLFHSDYKGLPSTKSSRRASLLSRSQRRGIQSVMKIELPKGYSRRRIGDFDLDNLFCGYYGEASYGF